MKKTFALLLTLSIIGLCASCSETPGDEQTSAPPASSQPAGDQASELPAASQTSTQSFNETGTVYTIIDYYDTAGGYSELGLALEEENGEKVLTVLGGDTLIVGGLKYNVTVESLTIPFYTQSSLDQVFAWWVDYCQSRTDRGELTLNTNE